MNHNFVNVVMSFVHNRIELLQKTRLQTWLETAVAHMSTMPSTRRLITLSLSGIMSIYMFFFFSFFQCVVQIHSLVLLILILFEMITCDSKVAMMT